MFGFISKKKVIKTAAEIIAEYDTSKVDYARDKYATRCYKDGHENALRGLVRRLNLMGEREFSDFLFNMKEYYRNQTDGEQNGKHR